MNDRGTSMAERTAPERAGRAKERGGVRQVDPHDITVLMEPGMERMTELLASDVRLFIFAAGLMQNA